MVALEEHKHLTEEKPIENLPLPAKVYIPLSQHIGRPCIPAVKPGDAVLTGQLIATQEAHVFSPVHASISGKVVSIEEWPHPVLGRGKAIVIESDGLDKTQSRKDTKSQEEVNRLNAEQIRKVVFDAGVVGLGGATFPAHIKLNPSRPVDTLIVNGAECEPYLTADFRLMVENTQEIISGIELAQRCLGVKKVYIAIEDNKPEAIKAFEYAIRNTQYAIRVLRSYYPQGGEKQLIKNILGKEVPSGKLPFDIGVVVHNVATLFAIYEAVFLGKPLYEKAITVTGDCIERPANVRVRVGTLLRDVVQACGSFKKEPKKIIFGGPMMGLAQYSQDVPIIKGTNGVIFISQAETKSADACQCMRCSRCVQQCPSGLMPCLITLAAEKENWEQARNYGCLDCIECGVCSYVCPQKIHLVQLIKHAKGRLAR